MSSKFSLLVTLALAAYSHSLPVASDVERRANTSNVKLPTSILPHKIHSVIPDTPPVALPTVPASVGTSMVTASSPTIPNTTPTTIADATSLIPRDVGLGSPALTSTVISATITSPTSTPAAADDYDDETPDTDDDGGDEDSGTDDADSSVDNGGGDWEYDDGY